MATPPAATIQPGTAAKVASYLTRLNPVPAFPEYTGPYKVGTVDVEIPTLRARVAQPEPRQRRRHPHRPVPHLLPGGPPTLAAGGSAGLPAPQRNHVSAYTKFLGLGPILAEVVS